MPSPPPLIAFLGAQLPRRHRVGWLFLGGLILLDVGRIGELLFTSENWLLTLILAAGGFAVTFGSLAMGTAIFLLPKRD